MCSCCRFVDDIENLLNQYASLKNLWFYRDLFHEVINTFGPNQLQISPNQLKKSPNQLEMSPNQL
jgi:hypothetical protein